MSVRVTTSMLFRTALGDVTLQRARLARVQEQASSGLRLNRPSDDPVGIQDATLLRSTLDQLAQYQRNQDRAELRLRGAETALDDAIDVVQRARELALAGANGTFDAETRGSLAEEVEQLHDRLLTRANARAGAGYVFAGFASDAPPFSTAGPFGGAPPAPAVAFAGDSNEVEIDVEQGARVPVTLDGRRVFLGDGDGDGSPDTGREDVFAVLGSLWEGLVSDDPAAVAATLDRLDRAQLQLSLARTRLGAIGARVEAARGSVSVRSDEAVGRLSEVQDADAVSVFSELVSQETALQASLQATARIVQPSLLDFLS